MNGFEIIQGGIPVKIDINMANYVSQASTSGGSKITDGGSSDIQIKQIKNTEKVRPSKSGQEFQTQTQLKQKPREELTIDEKAWVEMVERANKSIAGPYCNFEYSIHEATKQIMVKVIDQDTKEVIREIPPEKVLDMVAYMWELAGVIVDERR